MGFANKTAGYGGKGFITNHSRGYLRTASGYPCILTDCRENPLKALTVYGNSTQSGTPSVDNPAEIMGVGDRTENELYGYKLPVMMSGNLYTGSDLTVQHNNQFVTVNIPDGTYTVAAVFEATSDGKCVFAGKNYTGLQAGNTYIFIRNVSESFTFNIYGTINTGYAAGTLKNIQILEGSYTVETMPPYEPYHDPQSFDIYLDEQLNKVGNICDTVELDFENKSAVLTKRIGHLLFNGDEAWVADATSTDGEYRYQIFSFNNYITTDNNSNAAMCTHFTSGSTWTTSYRFGLSGSLNRLYIRTDGSPIGVFKEWLKEQYAAGTPVEIYYQYETPIITNISDKIDWDAIPKLWKGTVMITSGTQIPLSNIEAEYYATKK